MFFFFSFKNGIDLLYRKGERVASRSSRVDDYKKERDARELGLLELLVYMI